MTAFRDGWDEYLPVYLLVIPNAVRNLLFLSVERNGFVSGHD
jgi:hypothetical protein